MKSECLESEHLVLTLKRIEILGLANYITVYGQNVSFLQRKMLVPNSAGQLL